MTDFELARFLLTLALALTTAVLIGIEIGLRQHD